MTRLSTSERDAFDRIPTPICFRRQQGKGLDGQTVGEIERRQMPIRLRILRVRQRVSVGEAGRIGGEAHGHANRRADAGLHLDDVRASLRGEEEGDILGVRILQKCPFFFGKVRGSWLIPASFASVMQKA